MNIDTVLAELATKPPLYVPDGEGGWNCNINEYGDDRLVDEWISMELGLCMDDPFRFATRWCYSINEHLDDRSGTLPPSVELFPPWQYVRAFFSLWHPARDVIVEKSRDMLASWLAMGGVLHDLLFRKHWATMTFSRVETLVDDGGEASTTDSLHGKVRFIYERLPPFLKHSAPLMFRNLQIRNDAQFSHVTGFSATPSAGRGPKWKRAVGDEFAHVPWSEQVMSSIARACPNGKYLISTPKGKANAFYRIREASEQVYPPIPGQEPRHWKRIRIHWTEHPDHDQQWYDNQRASRSMTEEALAQELDISFTRSLGRRVYPRFMHEKHVAGSTLCPLSELQYSPNRPLYLTCDFNVDPLVWEIVQPFNEGVTFRVIGEICRRNAVVDDAILEFVFRFASVRVIEALITEHHEWGHLYGNSGIAAAGADGHTSSQIVIFGDATEEKSTVYSHVKMYQHIKAELEKYGFTVRLRVPPKNPPIRQRIETVNDALTHDLLVVSPACEQLRKDFEEGIWDSIGKDMKQAEDDDSSGLTRSHASSALGYLLCQLHRPSTSAAVPATRAHERRTSMKELTPDFIHGW